MASVPPSLKKISQFLRRAHELDRDHSQPESRVAAYHCRQYALIVGIPIASNSDAKQYLSGLMEELEAEKSAMTVFTKSEQWTICRRVADRVFDRADLDDRAGRPDKETAKTFYVAGTLYEILQQFYDSHDNHDKDNEKNDKRVEEEQRRLYCKWKATDILNAIKEGRTPLPGGYQSHKDSHTDKHTDTDQLTDTPLDSALQDLSPAPKLPPADFVKMETRHSYQENIEVNLNGEPTDANEASTSSSHPPPYPHHFLNDSSAQTQSDISPSSAISPRAATELPLSSPPKPSSTGLFSSLIGKKTSSTTTDPSPLTTNAKISKDQMKDAIELTKFALAALQKGEGDLGRQRLEQALHVMTTK